MAYTCDAREYIEFVMLLFLIALIVIVFVFCWLVIDYYTRQFVGLLDSAINVTRGRQAGFIRWHGCVIFEGYARGIPVLQGLGAI